MPFGELLVDNSTVDLDYRFSAKETDRESGLGYFGARYYDNISAMWLGVDPLWEKNIGASPYNYCHGNPIMMVDPDGMRSFSIIGEDGVSETIDDGVDGSFNIARLDFDLLKWSFDNNSNEDYNDYFNSLGLQSESYKMVLAAREHEGDESYAFRVKKGDFGANTNKCNKFVYDMLRKFGLIGKYPVGCPPTAGVYASNKKIMKGKNGQMSITTDGIRLGDVIAGSFDGWSDASGHVEIVSQVYPKGYSSKYEFKTIGAHGISVFTSEKGYQMYKGEACIDFRHNGSDMRKFDKVTVRRAKP